MVSEAARPAFERKLPVAGLRADELWQEVALALPALARPGAAHASGILAQAFARILLNAIDHARTEDVEVRLGEREGIAWFTIVDFGVGAFENVRAARQLGSALEALEEISKGKLTTQPERHAGGGLFFTSKMADRFELAANGIVWLVDNVRGDQGVGESKVLVGTAVRFEVSLAKEGTVEGIFARSTHDFDFDVTRTTVKLFEHGVRFIARSEAKRLLSGLEKFRHVIVDFKGVEAVGQGFADEVFRVWAAAHPDITLVVENMSEPVAFMVQRARRRGK